MLAAQTTVRTASFCKAVALRLLFGYQVKYYQCAPRLVVLGCVLYRTHYVLARSVWM